MFSPGDVVQMIERKTGYKKNIYAEAEDLVVVKSVDFLPVLILYHYGKPDKIFSARENLVSKELSKKNIARLKNEQSFKK